MKRLLILLLLLPLLATVATAAPTEIPTGPTEEDLGLETDGLTDELPEAARELLPVEGPEEDSDLWGGVWQLFLRGLPLSQESLRNALRLCAVMLALVALFSLSRMLSVGETAVRVAGALGLCAAHGLQRVPAAGAGFCGGDERRRDSLRRVIRRDGAIFGAIDAAHF